MPKLQIKDVIKYVEENIGDFHSRKLQNLKGLKLNSILKRKNLYLFKAKNILTASDLVKDILNAHLSSQEETIFGEFLEGLAIFICKKVYKGKKSSAEGIDLEFEKSKIRYIIAIKSGPNWGNSQQILRMKDNFRKAKRILRTSSSSINVIAVNGCCYGKDNSPDKGDYFKYCGQMFWEFISGNEKLYINIIEPLGHQAKKHNSNFLKQYAVVINNFTQEFISDYCIKGKICWTKLLKFNSGKGDAKKAM